VVQHRLKRQRIKRASPIKHNGSKEDLGRNTIRLEVGTANKINEKIELGAITTNWSRVRSSASEHDGGHRKPFRKIYGIHPRCRRIGISERPKSTRIWPDKRSLRSELSEDGQRFPLPLDRG
jgi:hypothetical protein